MNFFLCFVFGFYSYSDLCPVPEQPEIILPGLPMHDAAVVGSAVLDVSVVGATVLDAAVLPDKPSLPIAGCYDSLVTCLSDPLCRDPLLSGGKGASLAVMAALDMEQSPERVSALLVALS